MARTKHNSGGRTSVTAALLGNILVTLTKFAAAFLTGSAAMTSEGFHSLVDTGNEILLLYGLKRAARPPDLDHPFGHGRELYFWSFVVALLVFVFGACVSFYQGIVRILHPEPLRNVAISYGVLGLSALFEGASWLVARREFAAHKGSDDYLDAVRESKDPATFTVLFEDSAALLGLAVALAGILAAHYLDRPVFDGIASLGIGCILLVTAGFLVRETKSLLIGEKASAETETDILKIVRAEEGLRHANGVLTAHLGPDQVVVILSVEFEPDTGASAIEHCIEVIEQRLRRSFPEIVMVLVKPQKKAEWERRRAKLVEASQGQ